MADNAQRDELHLEAKKFQLLRLFKYFLPYTHLVIIGLVFAVLINVAVLVKPYVFKIIIDDYLTKKIYDNQMILILALVYFGITVVSIVIGYIQTYMLTYVGQKIMLTIRKEIFTHVQKMSMTFFDKNSSGRILTRITNDVESLSEIFSGVIVNLFRDSVLIIGLIVIMLQVNFRLGIISVSCVPVIMICMVIYRTAARKNFVKMKGMIARINGFLAEHIQGIKLIQIFHREWEKHKELDKLDTEYYKYSLREVILNSLGRPLTDIINNITIAILLVVAAGLISDNILEIGVVYLYVDYIKRFFEPISDIADKYTSIQSAFVSSERIFEILDIKELNEDMVSGDRIEEIFGNIEFKNVWFSYDNENWVLKDVSFKIKAGQTAAFVGATGSGKSTIINLMARYYRIQKGEITIDGKSIYEYNLKDLRRHISVVLQEVFLFSGTIADNIRLNSVNIADESISEALNYVNAESFIDSLSDGIQSPVMERGATFSSGQRQLLSFARAVAHKPSILILDEATASIDTNTEMLIQQAIGKITSGKTSIIIAHRLSTIKNADLIMVIDKGKIVEMGNNDELMALEGGAYFTLVQNSSVSINEVKQDAK